jgi:hypothetical protein
MCGVGDRWNTVSLAGASAIVATKGDHSMRPAILLSVVLGLLVQATFARADATTIRTGQVGGVPGSCSGIDDNFHYYAPNPVCGQPILATAFQSSDFDKACAGPQAVVITPYTPTWVADLACDPEARWIASSVLDPLTCWGTALSVLYCARFTVRSECIVADSIRVCWATDDFLGDQPSYPGPNPGGVYINGADLGPAFSGPGANQQYTAVAYNVPLNAGVNSLAVYQRDAGCGIAGLIMSATVYTNCGTVPAETKSWGSVKSMFR